MAADKTGSGCAGREVELGRTVSGNGPLIRSHGSAPQFSSSTVKTSTMTKTSIALFTVVVLVTPGRLRAQVGGNAGFGQTGGRARAEQSEHARRVISKDDHPPNGTATFLETNVLMNVKADEYVAVFAVSADGETVAECSRKLDQTLQTFLGEIKALGIAGDDVFVDFIAQNKTYGFAVEGDIAKEKLVGFELKKNVSIHYSDRNLLDKLTATAVRSQIFDLVKVDSIIKDLSKIQDKLADAAARVLDQKKPLREASANQTRSSDADLRRKVGNSLPYRVVRLVHRR
jgi:hypothetical protein